MNDITKLTTPNIAHKTLAEQRLDLQLRLQLNRRLLIYKFSGEEMKKACNFLPDEKGNYT